MQRQRWVSSIEISLLRQLDQWTRGLSTWKETNLGKESKTENLHCPTCEIYGQGHRRTSKNQGGDSGRERGGGDSCPSEMAIKPLNHQREIAERRDQGIIGGLQCEGEEGSTESSEPRGNCCRSTIQSQSVHECGPRPPLRAMLQMGPHPEQVRPPSTKLPQLCWTTPIERAQVHRGRVRINTGSNMQPYTRTMPELQGESYCIQRIVYEENRGHHKGATEQESATEWTRDTGGSGGQQSSARHQAG